MKKTLILFSMMLFYLIYFLFESLINTHIMLYYLILLYIAMAYMYMYYSLNLNKNMYIYIYLAIIFTFWGFKTWNFNMLIFSYFYTDFLMLLLV